MTMAWTHIPILRRPPAPNPVGPDLAGLGGGAAPGGSRRTLIGRLAGGVAVALLAVGAAAAPALADNDRHRGWHKGYHQYYGPPGHAKKHYSYAVPYHYVAPAYVYAPPPVAYVPAPVYRPSPSLTLVIPFEF